MSNKKKLWIIMKVRPFSGLKAGGGEIDLNWPDGFPTHFAPVFESRDAAVKFNDGKDDSIFECVSGAKD